MIRGVSLLLIVWLLIPGVVHAQPVPLDRGSSGHLSSFAQYVPIADEEATQLVRYVNIDLWLNYKSDHIRLTPEDLPYLPLPAPMATHGFEDIWLETYGFSIDEVDQLLVSGENVTSVLVLRGRWREMDLFGIWAQHGYQAVAVGSRTVWTVHPFDEDVISFANPASRLADGMMNNLVLMDDGTLVATSTFSHLKRVIGTGDMLSDVESVADYLESATSPMISALIAYGGPELDEDDPETDFAVFAEFVHEGTGEAVLTLNLVADSGDDAEELSALLPELISSPWSVRRSVVVEDRVTLVLDYERPPVLWSRFLSEPLFLSVLRLID